MCSATSYTACFDFQRALHGPKCSTEPIQECHQQTRNLARTVLAGSLLVRRPSFVPLYHPCSLPQPLQISTAVLLLPGTRTSGQILCQVPWAVSHPSITRTQHCGSIPIFLVGRDETIAPQTTARLQLPGYLP